MISKNKDHYCSLCGRPYPDDLSGWFIEFKGKKSLEPKRTICPVCLNKRIYGRLTREDLELETDNEVEKATMVD